MKPTKICAPYIGSGYLQSNLEMKNWKIWFLSQYQSEFDLSTKEQKLVIINTLKVH